jgi:phosphoribosyl 1,2-cyclic phosphodiesterase
MAVQFAMLASGSRGNACLVRSGGAGLLIDVGLGPRAMARRLESVGSSWDQIGAAVLTHTHGDHVHNATLHTLADRRIWFTCHEGHREALSDFSGFQALEAAGLVRYYDSAPFLSQTGLQVEPREVSHDAGPTFGFRIEAKPGRGQRPVSIGYVADTGCWSESMADLLSDAALIGVEFNHDEEMQRRSPRSPLLIARNLGDRGHLSNTQAADLVSAVLDRSSRSSVRHLVLLHLSEQCNTPGLALHSARTAIKGTGRRIVVHAALQSPAHPNVLLESSPRRTISVR